MQKFSWNLDNFKFEAGFEPEPINCKSVTLATRPWARDVHPFSDLGKFIRKYQFYIENACPAIQMEYILIGITVFDEIFFQ